MELTEIMAVIFKFARCILRTRDKQSLKIYQNHVTSVSYRVSVASNK